MEETSRYRALYPPESTREDELCKCDGPLPIKLMYAFGYNPIHCMQCNLEVPPETLDLSSELITGLAFWRFNYAAIDHLWLASGDYELWAKEQLSNVSNRLNGEGRELQGELNELRRCYYWLFQDESAEDYEPMSHCPACGEALTLSPYGIFAQLVCEKCSIVIAGEKY